MATLKQRLFLNASITSTPIGNFSKANHYPSPGPSPTREGEISGIWYQARSASIKAVGFTSAALLRYQARSASIRTEGSFWGGVGRVKGGQEDRRAGLAAA